MSFNADDVGFFNFSFFFLSLFHFYYSGDMTGKYSVYTLYEGHEIMFHVSTLLPFSKDNRQQVSYDNFISLYYLHLSFMLKVCSI